MNTGTSFLIALGSAVLTIGAVYFLFYANPGCNNLGEEALETCLDNTKSGAYKALFFGILGFVVFSLVSGEK